VGTTAPDAVKCLVDLSACNAQADRFDRDRKVFLSPDYKEEQLRAEFLSFLRAAPVCPPDRTSSRFRSGTCPPSFLASEILEVLVT
jgi:hypothetical protein